MKMLKNTMTTLFAVLQEIFDESAYHRFLSRSGLLASRESYAIFLRELEPQRVHRARCC